MKLRLDPWPAEYEGAMQIDDASPEPSARIDPTVETAGWQAVCPTTVHPPACYFVDGVRRVEARVMGTFSGVLTHGPSGSLATGHVRAENSNASFGPISVERYLVLGHGQLETMLDYALHCTLDNTSGSMLGALQGLMRSAEARVAESLTSAGGCVFVDGPSYRATGTQEVIGVIKRIFEPYLPPEQFQLVDILRRGERTPLFSIIDGVYDRFSCFLRLADPRAIEHALVPTCKISEVCNYGS